MMCNQALIMTNYDNTNQNMATLKHFKEAAENCGFRVSVPMTQGNETTIELYQQLPSGKDWWETLQFADPKDLTDIILERIDTWDDNEENYEWMGDDDTDTTGFGLDDAAWKEEKLFDLYNEISI